MRHVRTKALLGTSSSFSASPHSPELTSGAWISGLEGQSRILNFTEGALLALLWDFPSCVYIIVYRPLSLYQPLLYCTAAAVTSTWVQNVCLYAQWKGFLFFFMAGLLKQFNNVTIQKVNMPETSRNVWLMSPPQEEAAWKCCCSVAKLGEVKEAARLRRALRPPHMLGKSLCCDSGCFHVRLRVHSQDRHK